MTKKKCSLVLRTDTTKIGLEELDQQMGQPLGPVLTDPVVLVHPWP